MHSHDTKRTSSPANGGGDRGRASPGASDRSTNLAVDGMTCSGCARNVTEALRAVPGVVSATVTLENRRAAVRWSPEATVNVEGLVRAVSAAGYDARPLAEHSVSAEKVKLSTWGISVLTGIIPTALLMIGEWIFNWQHSPALRWVAFALSTVVVFGPGMRFFKGAWRQLRAGTSNMDTLVALGSTTAYAFSAWVILAGRAEHLYFMEAAAIITLISVGHWLEARVSARASSSLRALMDLAPALAIRRGTDGSERSVPIAQLAPGDLVVLRPGDRVATDGEVLEGASAVDESMLTGESLPVEKTPGTRLYAGALNQSGRLLARVSSIGADTALAHIIAAVQCAQDSRANIQRLGDRVASVFVPIVVFVALAAACGWGFAPEQARHLHESLAPAWWHLYPPPGALAGAVYIAAAVLIVACPCAMGLATPAAIMAGSNAAARRGILIRDGVALEKAGGVTAVLFDKTGTLTEGKPAVAAMEFFEPTADSERRTALLELAAALARPSAHPLSQAIAKLQAGDVALSGWTEVRGAGLEARWQSPDGSNPVVRLGSFRWLREMGAGPHNSSDADRAPGPPRSAEPLLGEDPPSSNAPSGGAALRSLQSVVQLADAFTANWLETGATLLGLAIDDSLVAAFAVKDNLKSGVRAVVEQLRHQGLRAFLVSGDNVVTARSIGEQAGIAAEDVFAEVRPEEKAALVRRLQDQGERVAFVGDGINDAPALEQADLGIAVSRASDVAREAADMILLRSDIDAVPEALGLARATLRTIRQNLFWAFFYNAASIPMAALGFMSPVLCAATMGFSDIVVIGNALRLLGWKK